MGRPRAEITEENKRAMKLFKEMGCKSNYPLTYVIWFINEWEQTVAKLRKGK